MASTSPDEQRSETSLPILELLNPRTWMQKEEMVSYSQLPHTNTAIDYNDGIGPSTRLRSESEDILLNTSNNISTSIPHIGSFGGSSSLESRLRRLLDLTWVRVLLGLAFTIFTAIPWIFLLIHIKAPGSLCTVQAPPAWSCRVEWEDTLQYVRSRSYDSRIAEFALPMTKGFQAIATTFLAEDINRMTGIELLGTNSMEYMNQFRSSDSSSNVEPSIHQIDPISSANTNGSLWSHAHLIRWQERSAWSESTLRKLQSLSPSLSVKHPTIFDFRVMIVTGSVYHRTRADTAMATWGETLPSSVITMISDKPDDAMQLPILPIENTNGYGNSQRKWIEGWKHVWNLEPRRSWYVTVDDDVYLSVPNLLELVSTLDPSRPLMIGHLCEFPNWHATLETPKAPLQRVCGGGGWLMSRATVELIEPMIHECQQYYSPMIAKSPLSSTASVFIGACLKNKIGSKITWIDVSSRFHLDVPAPTDYSTQPLDTIFQPVVTYHYMKEPAVIDLFQLEMSYTERNRMHARRTLKQKLDWLRHTETGVKSPKSEDDTQPEA